MQRKRAQKIRTKMDDRNETSANKTIKSRRIDNPLGFLGSLQWIDKHVVISVIGEANRLANVRQEP